MVGQRLSLRARALSFLARREHSRAELVRKLQSHTEDPDELKRLLDDFEQRGWLSEKRLVEQTVSRLAAKYGAQRIAHTLREKGVCEAAIAAALAEVKDNELAAARSVLRRKFSMLPATKEERARQSRFLQGRGFGYDVIRRALRNSDDESE
jgi:regulatory protein